MLGHTLCEHVGSQCCPVMRASAVGSKGRAICAGRRLLVFVLVLVCLNADNLKCVALEYEDPRYSFFFLLSSFFYSPFSLPPPPPPPNFPYFFILFSFFVVFMNHFTHTHDARTHSKSNQKVL